MKFLSLLLTFFALLGLMACQPRSQTGGSGTPGGTTVPNTTPGPVTPVPSSPAGPSPYGGADPVGGGNGVEGLMIEDFRIYMESTDAYKRLQEKVFKKLAVKFPKLAADLKFIANHKRWYLIPTELRTLPSGRIGVSFKTDQYGLQTPTEIYLDKRFYREMSETAQETLILHELVMGVRLLEFANPLELCLVEIEVMTFDDSAKEAYSERRKRCFAENKALTSLGSALNLQKRYKLEDHDYPFIRDLTSTLLKSVDSLDPQELEVWMEVNNFRKYPQVQGHVAK